MENHPIPQDVTGFQFKLIGNMTIKQFGYVAFGVILAVILYYLPLNSFAGAVIKIAFIPLLGGSGIALAFLPIEGRPIDTMLANFLKALFSPNQYIYQKTGRMFSFTSIAAPPSQPRPQATTGSATTSGKSIQLQQFMEGSSAQTQNKLDQRESAFIQSVFAPETSSILARTPAPNSPIPVQVKPLVAPSVPAEPILQPRPVLAPTPPVPAQQQQPIAPIIAAPVPTPIPPKPVDAQVKKTDLPHTPDVPNVIVGIVKDPRGNVLPNILVEVKDKLGNPIRAFKTNALGQFASATPLLPGNYTVELEDPKKQNTFTVIQLTADNRILLPIEIVSHDAREELRRQLFSN